MRNVMAPAGFTIHSMQVVPWKRAAPMCPSTQPAAGAKSPCGRLLASESMLDDGFGTGRAEFVAHTSCQRCVSHSLCSRPFVGCHRMRTCVHCKPRNHGRSTRQRMSLRARCHTFGQRIHTSMQSSSLAPRRRTRHLPISIHGRPLAEGRLGRKGAWGGREPGAEGSMGRKRGWGGREPKAEGSLGRKGGRGGSVHRSEYGADGRLGRKGAWGGREYGAQGTPQHTSLHFDPQAATFLSPPGGIYLILF